MKPMSSQTMSRIQFVQPSPYIMALQVTMPSVATNGAAGTRNPRSSSGCFTRMIHTPAQTRMNANNVPMLVISPVTSAGTSAARAPVKTKNSMFDFHGVRYRGCTSEKIDGTSPSRLIEKNTRDWPNNITRMTDEKPARIATVTERESHSYPCMYLLIANATDASLPAVRKSSIVATPLNTYENST